jgi:hypothetical protein
MSNNANGVMLALEITVKDSLGCTFELLDAKTFILAGPGATLGETREGYSYTTNQI